MKSKKEVTETASSIEKAIDAGVEKLGVDKSEVDFEIIHEPKAGILGFGSKKAKVRVFLRAEKETKAVKPEKAERKSAPRKREEASPANVPADVEPIIQDSIEYVGRFLDPEFRVHRVSEDGAYLHCEVKTQDQGLVLGRKGVTLDAIETIARAMISAKTGRRMKLSLDMEDFRARRKSVLESTSREAAEEVRQDGRAVHLDPMSPRDRRVVHEALKDEKGIRTESEGRGEDRHVTIHSTDAAHAPARSPERRPEGRSPRENRSPRREKPVVHAVAPRPAAEPDGDDFPVEDESSSMQDEAPLHVEEPQAPVRDQDQAQVPTKPVRKLVMGTKRIRRRGGR